MRHSKYILLCLISAKFVLAKTVTLKWAPVEGALSYQIEIFERSKRVFQTEVKSTPSPHWKRAMRPGVYQYRVRAINVERAPGKWSVLHALAVPPSAPKALFPPNGKIFSTSSPVQSVKFQWTRVPLTTSYWLIIERDGKRVTEAFTTDLSNIVNELPSGKYQWTIQALISHLESSPQLIAQSPPVLSSFEIRFNKPRREERQLSSTLQHNLPARKSPPFSFRDLHISAHMQINPYSYATENPAASVSKRGVGAMGGVDYYFGPKWGMGIVIEDNFFQIQNELYDVKRFGLSANYRWTFSKNRRSAFILIPKVGLHLSEYLHLTPGLTEADSPTPRKIFTAGPTASMEARKYLGESFSAGLAVQGYFPMVLLRVPAGETLTLSGTSVNFRITADALYEFSEYIGARLGVLYQKHIVKYKDEFENGYTSDTGILGAYAGISLAF